MFFLYVAHWHVHSEINTLYSSCLECPSEKNPGISTGLLVHWTLIQTEPGSHREKDEEETRNKTTKENIKTQKAQKGKNTKFQKQPKVCIF